MELSNFARKYQVIIILSCVVVIMSAIKLSYKAPVVDTSQLITPTVTIVPAATVTPISAMELDYPLWQYLPYQGKGFTIDRYQQPGLMVGYLEGAITEEASKSAEGWMEEKGIDPTSQKIEWRTK